MAKDPTIYVVDDNEVVRDSLRSLLEAYDLRVEAFSSAQAFLDDYREERPACLVLDINMPGMNGFELQNYLVEESIHIPIIFVGGRRDESVRVQALTGGTYAYLQKPFGSEELLAGIQKALASDSQA